MIDNAVTAAKENAPEKWALSIQWSIQLADGGEYGGEWAGGNVKSISIEELTAAKNHLIFWFHSITFNH